MNTAAALPNVCAWGGVEVRLGMRSRQVDLGLCVQRTNGGVQELANAFGRSALPGWLDALEPFLTSWLDDTGPLMAELDHVWFEVDHPEDGKPQAFAYPCINASYGSPDQHRIARDQTVRLVETLAPGLLGCPLATEQKTCIATAIGHLPETVVINHAATMLHRGSAAIRLAMGGFEGTALDWLDAIEWAGNRDTARSIIDGCGLDPRSVNLLLDFGQSISKRIGVFFTLTPETAEGALAFVRARSLCTDEEVDALQSVLGASRHRLDDIGFVVNIERHVGIKIQLAEDGTCLAKAYLTFLPTRRLF